MSAKSKSLLVTLRLSPDSLKDFPHEPAAPPKEETKASPPTPAPQIIEPSPADTPADSTTNMNGNASTPSSLAPPGPKRKGPKPGSKRNAAQMEAGTNGTTPKSKAKPGPKRKKMGDIINDPNSKGGPFAAPAAINKAGPKANLGAINERLRALDRSGTKCRKWEKRGFHVRSFTGVLWQVPTYQPGGRHSAFLDDVKSDSTGTSDSKLKDESSAVSDKSGLNGDGSTPVPTPLNGIASSPAPISAA